MKHFSILLIVMLASVLMLGQHRSILIDSSLRNNSEVLTPKRKIIVGGKYDFGAYKMIRSKHGVETSRTRQGLFSRVSETESKAASSFVMVGGDDTVVVNLLSKRSHTEERRGGGLDREIIAAHREINGEIEIKGDSTIWEIKGSYLLTDGDKKIEISKVNESADGKKSLLWFYNGYVFTLNKKQIGAVQTLTKQYIWLDKELDPRMKLVLAAAAASFLFTEQ